MSTSNAPPHVSLQQIPPDLPSCADVCVESDVTTSATDSEDEHTLTAFGDVSLTEEQIICSAPRPLNKLRLKVKRPPFPKKRTSIQEGQFSPKSPAGKFFEALGSSLVSSPLSPSFFIDSLTNSPRSGTRHATQRSAVEPETHSPPLSSPVPREPTFSTSSASSQLYDCQLRQSVIAKTVPSVADVAKPTKVWKKLPSRLPIPKWDVDD
ncbi:hypothetical protein DFH29DRAFT_876723 [Suillus ampliporus]|nr:hypothetical protein DFH29DRAFT_876723 [Suillus ampliporus]